MRKTVLDAYNAEREVDNITYKNLVVTIASVLGFSLLGGLFLALALGIFGEEVLRANLEGYYLLLFDAAVVTIVLFAYKPVLHFIKNIWDVSILKKWENLLVFINRFYHHCINSVCNVRVV